MKLPMHIRVIVAFVSIVLPMASLALDAGDIGTYRVINVRGEPTAKVFRLQQSGSAWKIEDKQADGSWVDVTCDTGCELQDSTEADLRRFFPADELSKVALSCVHSEAFAFCRFIRHVGPQERSYLFVALTQGQPIWLRLVRE